MSRVPVERRWNPKDLLAISGTPDAPNPKGHNDAALEALCEPRGDADKELRDLRSAGGADIGSNSNWFSLLRITKANCKEFGRTQDCIRCTRLQLGDNTTSTNHTEACRSTLYTQMLDSHHPRFMQALKSSHEFAKRARILEEHDAKEAVEAHVPELVGDDDGDLILIDDPTGDHHPAALMQCLMSYGVSRYGAVCTVARMTHSPGMPPCTFHEVYGRGAIVQAANDNRRNLNVKGLRVFELRTDRPDGTYWTSANCHISAKQSA